MMLEISEREHALMLLSMSVSPIPEFLIDDFIVLYRRVVNLGNGNPFLEYHDLERHDLD
jgi:hypothetical protein